MDRPRQRGKMNLLCLLFDDEWRISGGPSTSAAGKGMAREALASGGDDEWRRWRVRRCEWLASGGDAGSTGGGGEWRDGE